MSDKVELPNNHPSPEEPARVHPNPSACMWQQRRIREPARDSDPIYFQGAREADC